MGLANETPWQRYTRRMAQVNVAMSRLEQERREINEELNVADLLAAKNKERYGLADGR